MKTLALLVLGLSAAAACGSDPSNASEEASEPDAAAPVEEANGRSSSSGGTSSGGTTSSSSSGAPAYDHEARALRRRWSREITQSTPYFGRDGLARAADGTLVALLHPNGNEATPTRIATGEPNATQLTDPLMEAVLWLDRTTGNLVRVRPLGGGVGYAYTSSLAVDAAGTVHVSGYAGTGSFTASAPMTLLPGTAQATSVLTAGQFYDGAQHGTSDVFHTRLAADGQPSWLRVGRTQNVDGDYGPTTTHGTAVDVDGSSTAALSLSGPGLVLDHGTAGPLTVARASDSGRCLFVHHDGDGARTWVWSSARGFCTAAPGTSAAGIAHLTIQRDPSAGPGFVQREPASGQPVLNLSDRLTIAAVDRQGAIAWSARAQNATLFRNLVHPDGSSTYLLQPTAAGGALTDAAGTVTALPAFQDAAYLVRFDSNGAVRWAVPRPTGAYFSQLVALADGSMWAAGYTRAGTTQIVLGDGFAVPLPAVPSSNLLYRISDVGEITAVRVLGAGFYESNLVDTGDGGLFTTARRQDPREPWSLGTADGEPLTPSCAVADCTVYAVLDL